MEEVNCRRTRRARSQELVVRHRDRLERRFVALALVVAIAAAGSLTCAAPVAAARTNDASQDTLAQAEEAYRARRWSQALEAFNAVVAAQPNHAGAWLRIGNLQQRRRQLLAAASAYRKAARHGAAARSDGTSEIRAKALINLAIVNLELAESALGEIDRMPAELRDTHDAVGAAIRRAREEADRQQAQGAAARTSGHRASATGSPESAKTAGKPRAEIEYLQWTP